MEQNDQHALLFRKAVDPEKTQNKWKLWLLSGSVNRQNQEVHKRRNKKVSPAEEEEGKKSKLGEMVAKLEHTLEQHDEVGIEDLNYSERKSRSKCLSPAAWFFLNLYFISGAGSQF